MQEYERKLKEYRRLKLQLYNILSSNKQCCALCLATNTKFFDLHDQIHISHWDETCMLSMETILATIFNKMDYDFLCEQICEQCKETAVRAFQFIQNTINTLNILDDYVIQLNNSINKANDPMNLRDSTNMILVLNNPFVNNDVESYSFNYNDKEHIESNSENCSDNSESLEIFECDYCKTSFKNKMEIVRHIEKMHTNAYSVNNSRIEKRLTCSECDEISCKHHRYLNAYREHFNDKNKFIQCPDCEYACHSKVDLITHANKVHLNIFSSVCEYCGKSFHSIKQYKMHVFRYHTKHLSCEYCDHCFKVEKNLLKHKQHCKKQSRLFKCIKCPASFNTKRKLAFHSLKHEKEYPCKFCNKVFTKEVLVELHSTITHLDKEVADRAKFICFICHEVFLTKKQRKEHMIEHGSNEKFKCISCNLEFNTLENYKTHTRSFKHLRKINPNRQYKYKCEFCSYSTIMNQNLEAHVNRHHLKVAPYECQKCPRKFLNAKRLETHKMANHDLINKQSVYYCDICGNHFRSATALQMHRRRHTGEKPYKCENCEEKFVSASTRNVHRLKVHSEKKLKCPLCDYMSHTLCDVRSHFKKVHWKRKGEAFDIRKVEGLTEKDYELFRDRRLVKL